MSKANEGAPGTCCAWASTYGLATFTAARAGRVDPSQPSGQASPAQLYIEILGTKVVTHGTCEGTSFSDYFPLLQKNGTQSLADAPYILDCTSLWLAYQTGSAKPRNVFRIGETSAIHTNDLDSLKTGSCVGSSALLRYTSVLGLEDICRRTFAVLGQRRGTDVEENWKARRALYADYWLQRCDRRSFDPEQRRAGLGYRGTHLDGVLDIPVPG